MVDPGEAQPRYPGESEDRAGAPLSNEERAAAVIRAIAEGADPGEEAFRLSNSFTDSWTARAGAAVRRLFRRT